MPRRGCRARLGALVIGLVLAWSGGALGQGFSEATRGLPLPGPGPRAYVALVIDDLANLDLWAQLAADAGALGMRTTLALNTARTSPEQYARLAGLVKAGHEVANHTRDHVPVTAGGVVKLRYFAPQAKSAQAVVDGPGARLRLMVNDNPAPAAEFDLSENGPQANLGQLVEALNNVRGVAAELGDPYYANIQSRFLLDRERTDIFFKNGFAPLFLDVPAHARYEMTGAKQDIEAGLPGYAVTSMIYPFLVSDAATRRIARELGMTCGRVGTTGNAALGAPGGYDPFQIFATKPRDAFGPDPAAPQFADKVRAFLKKLKEVGGVCCLYSHGPDEFTNEQWRTLLALLAKDQEVAYVTLAELGAFVRKTGQPRDGRYFLPRAGG